MRLPDKVIWPATPTRQMGRWVSYIPMGFKSLGIRIEESQALSEEADIRLYQELKVRSVGGFYLVYGEKRRKIWYDTGCFVNHHGYEKLVKGDDLYFKIRMTKEHRTKYPRMFPIGNRVTRPQEYFNLLPRLRKESRSGKYEYDIIGIQRLTNYKMRVKSVQLILAQPWKSVAWLTPHSQRPTAPDGLMKPIKYAYDRYLLLQAHTKIGLALPGVGDLTFRQIELMAMGRPCLISEPSLTPVAPADRAWIEVKPDMSNFVETVNYYLENDVEREAIGVRGQIFYERYFSPLGQAKYILKIAEKHE